ncbi:MAG: Uma2 family endonuclease [Anaerolineae bacterium]
MVDQLVSTKIQSAAFFALAGATDDRLELIDGEVIVMPSPSVLHQELLLRLALWFHSLISIGRLFVAPLDVRIDDENIVQPDLLWVAPNGKAVITDQRIEGAPDLVIEILSEATLRRDKTVKFLLYEKSGVREYWLVDPAGTIEVWTLSDKEYAHVGTYKSGDTLASPLLSVSLDLTQVFTTI